MITNVNCKVCAQLLALSFGSDKDFKSIKRHIDTVIKIKCKVQTSLQLIVLSIPYIAQKYIVGGIHQFVNDLYDFVINGNASNNKSIFKYLM
jgi:hypothetical protein